MKILFITANRIGDVVLTTGLLSWLEKTYSDARFTIACGPVTADLFRAFPRLDRLILLQKQKRHGHWIDLWKECVGTKWDIIVDLRNSFITRLLRAKKKHYRLAHNTGRHKVEDHASVLNLSPPPAPFLWIDAQTQAKADKLVPFAPPILALGPAANWAPKQWATENFAALAQRLTASDGPLPNAKVMIVAAPHEREMIAHIFDVLPKEQIIDLVGLDLLTVAACLKKARLFIGNDSGLMHIAAAVGTPTLGLFGPGYEKVYGPWGAHTATVRTKESTAELLALQPYPGSDLPLLMGGLSIDKAEEAAIRVMSLTK